MVKNWKQAKSSSIEEEINNLWYMEWNTPFQNRVLRRKGLQIHTIGINLKNIRWTKKARYKKLFNAGLHLDEVQEQVKLI